MVREILFFAVKAQHLRSTGLLQITKIEDLTSIDLLLF